METSKAYVVKAFSASESTSGDSFISIRPDYPMHSGDGRSHCGVTLFMDPAQARALAADLLAAADHADGDEPCCFAINHRNGGDGPWLCLDNNLTEAEAHTLFAKKEEVYEGGLSDHEWQIVREIPVTTEAQ
jgi:hypothetical protein